MNVFDEIYNLKHADTIVTVFSRESITEINPDEVSGVTCMAGIAFKGRYLQSIHAYRDRCPISPKYMASTPFGKKHHYRKRRGLFFSYGTPVSVGIFGG